MLTLVKDSIIISIETMAVVPSTTNMIIRKLLEEEDKTVLTSSDLAAILPPYPQNERTLPPLMSGTQLKILPSIIIPRTIIPRV